MRESVWDAGKTSNPRIFHPQNSFFGDSISARPRPFGVPVVAVVFRKTAVSYQMTSVSDRITENMRNEINKKFDVPSARKFKNKYLRRRVRWEVCVEPSFSWK